MTSVLNKWLHFSSHTSLQGHLWMTSVLKKWLHFSSHNSLYRSSLNDRCHEQMTSLVISSCLWQKPGHWNNQLVSKKKEEKKAGSTSRYIFKIYLLVYTNMSSDSLCTVADSDLLADNYIVHGVWSVWVMWYFHIVYHWSCQSNGTLTACMGQNNYNKTKKKKKV